jgi:regulatory protein
VRRKILTEDQALQKLRHFCRYQERCKNDVLIKMRTLLLPASMQTSMITRLTSEGFLDDQRFANAYAEGKFSNNGWGRQKIIYELRSRKFEPSAIKQAVSAIDADLYLRKLDKLVKTRYDSLTDEKIPVRRKKTIEYLMARGYEYDLVRLAVEDYAK